MKETKEIKTREYVINVEEKKDKDGKKFNTYHTYSKNGRKINVKFRKEVRTLPTEKCIIVVADDKCNLKTNDLYPVLWVAEIEEIKPFEVKSQEQVTKELDEMFG